MTRMSTVCIGFATIFAVWVLHASAVPLGDRSEVAAATTTEVALVNVTVVDTLNTELSNGNETEHSRVKRSGCCGCCCCRPCCCCCKPCCCCCKPCCCCCRCCCCCCRCCCCRCCCCRPCCCCGGCGCCGCGGGRKRRSIAALTHKLMDKQAAIIRASAEIVVPADIEAASELTTIESAALIASTTTTVAPIEAITIAQMDSYGRRQF